jgi:hypothetical protein
MTPETAARPVPGDPPPKPPRQPAAETARLYAGDWAAFLRWCRAAQAGALPADPATVASYLGSVATLSRGALGRRLAAIAQAHRQHGYPAPGADPAIRALLQAARRRATQRRRPTPGPGQLARMATRCPGDLAGLRDRAVLLLAATGLGRAALVGLDAEQIRFTAAGLEVPGDEAVLPASEAEGRQGHRLSVPRGAVSTCPVRALEDWLRASDTRFGPVFRKIDRWGTVEHRRLGADAIRRILSRRALRRAAKAGAA